MYNKSKEKISSKQIPIPKPVSKAPKLLPKQRQNMLPSIKNQTNGSKRPVDRVQTGIKPDRSTQKSKNVVVKKQERRPMTYTKQGFGSTKSKVKQGDSKPGWSRIPLHLLINVAEYCCTVSFDIYKLSLVCSTWRSFMDCQQAIYLWSRFKKTSGATSFQEYKNCMISDLKELKQKRALQFETIFTKLFNYGSTKQNIPNKLITKLKLDLEVTINGKVYKQYKYKLRQFNFSSYLYTKINELSKLPFDMYTPHNFFKDKLKIEFKFYSRTYKVAHHIKYQFTPQQVAECAIKQKAFNYFLAKNLIITFFEGDNTFLYCFLQISLLELITQFRRIIKQDFQEHIDKKTKKLPLYKKLCETEFEDFVEYIKYQADFELHMSYHNSVQQIFTHCDTKVFPVEYSPKQAYFDVKIDDTFQKTSTFLLDNKMGMSEPIQDLYLLDFVLKDRDRFIIVFSGFIYARKASQKERQSIDNYFEHAELPIKMIQFKNKKYQFSIMVIEEKKKNLIKFAKFSIFP